MPLNRYSNLALYCRFAAVNALQKLYLHFCVSPVQNALLWAYFMVDFCVNPGSLVCGYTVIHALPDKVCDHCFIFVQKSLSIRPSPQNQNIVVVSAILITSCIASFQPSASPTSASVCKQEIEVGKGNLIGRSEAKIENNGHMSMCVCLTE